MFREEVDRGVNFFGWDFGMKSGIRVHALVWGPQRIEKFQVPVPRKELIFELHKIEKRAADGVGVLLQTVRKFCDRSGRPEKSQDSHSDVVLIS